MIVKKIEEFENKYFDRNPKGEFLIDNNRTLHYSVYYKKNLSETLRVSSTNRVDAEFVCKKGKIIDNPNHVKIKSVNPTKKYVK